MGGSAYAHESWWKVWIPLGWWENHTHTEPKYFAILDLTEFSVLPSAPVSPLELFSTNKKKLPSRNGVMILQHGDDVPIMVHAAKQACFTLNLAELTLIAGELGVDAPGVSVPLTVTTLVQHVLSAHYKTK